MEHPNYLHIAITLIALSAIFYALLRNLSRPDFIFLGGLVVLLVTGVLTPAQAFSGFANEAVFTVAALFVVASAVQKTRALSFLELLIFRDSLKPRTLLARMMLSTSAMSAFLNNTPIVAMLIPQVQQWAARNGVSSSRLLIPLSYGAIVGGVVTLIGTSTNLIVSGMLTDRGYEPLSLFELSWIGVPAVLLVVVYFYTIGYRFLPGTLNRKEEQESENSHRNGYQFDLKIPAGSDLAGKTVDEAGLRALDRLFLIHVLRQNRILGPIGPHFLLEANDILTFIGEIDAVDDLAVRKELERTTPHLDKSDRDLPLFEAVIAPTSTLIGKTLKESQFREQYHGVVIGIQRRDETIRGALGNIPVRSGDLLLIEAKKGFDDRFNQEKDHFYLVTRKGQRDLPASEKAPLALGVTLLMVLAATTGWVPIVTAALSAAFIMVLTGCIQKNQVLNAVHLPILLVIAAAIGFGQAIDSTGIARISGMAILDVSGMFGVVALIVSLYLITNLFTELITNNAAAVLMVPIALVAALEIGIDSHAAAVTVAVAASASFLTPIGYQTNLMVMGAGGYKFTDYLKAGFPVTLIMLVTTVLVVSWRYL